MKKLFDKTILYVEDDISSQEEVSFFLKTFIKNIFIADNGEAALEYFNTNKIDLIITDIQMPKMNGIEMIKRVRKINTTIPIIILTAFNESRYLLEALKLGVNNYLFKPINLKEVKDSIFEHLSLSDSEEKLLNYSLNEAGEIIDVSDSWLNYFGYKKDEVLQRHLLDFVDSQYKRVVREELKVLPLNGYINNLYIKLISQDGSRKDVILDAGIIKNKAHNTYVISSHMQSLKYLMSSKNNILQLLKEEKYLKDLVTTYAQIGKCATEIGSVKEFFEAVCNHFMNNTEYEFAFITRIEGDDLKIVGHSTNHEKDLASFSLEPVIKDFRSTVTIMAQAYNSKSISVIENLADIENYENKRQLIEKGIYSLVSIPLKFGEDSEVFATLTLMLKHIHKFMKEEFNQFSNIADMIILGIQTVENKLEKENLLHELYVRATRDFLTNCINRQEGVNIIKREMERSIRYENRLCVVFFDIDKFKTINDNYGHNIGDKVLINVSNTIKNSLRTSDYIIRWGGEEFIILLPEVGIEGAVAFTKKIQQEIRDLVIENLKVTISFGVTEYKKHESWEGFIERADQLMYQAKNNGRDQYVFD